MIKALMLASAAVIAVGLAVPSNASARVYYRYGPPHTYRPPAGQIWERGIRNSWLPEERARQDFQPITPSRAGGLEGNRQRRL
jgi:hypothetical protein